MMDTTPTDKQLHTLRHMLGINTPADREPKPYRDYAAVVPGDPEFVEMERQGFVVCYRKAFSASQYDYYRCTPAGRTAAMASHKTIRNTKASRVYSRFLDCREVFQDLTFKEFLTDRQFAETRRSA